jgi:putative ABC transport system substrate-binding protein
LVWSGNQGSEVAGSATQLAAFRAGLQDAGWIEGQNLVIDERHYADHPELMPDLAIELVALKPDVLVGGLVPTPTFMRATDSIPIVFGGVADPVGIGLVASFARPGGNVTGTSRTTGGTLTRKKLDLLRQLLPGLARVAVVFSSQIPSAVEDFRLFEHLAGQIADMALQAHLPTAFNGKEQVEAGALLGYGPNQTDLQRRGAAYVDKILRGAKPADLPVEQPTVFEFSVNVKTSQALGIAIPPDVAAQVTDWVQQ